MKKMFSLLFIALCVASVGNAQTVLKVTVPFDFVVGNNTLPAADYNIQKLLNNDSTGIAFVRDGAFVQSRASSIDSTVNGARLDFVKIGKQYFLTNVVTATGSLHFPIWRKQEKLAANSGQTSSTTVAAK
jgi:hypothetical protein